MPENEHEPIVGQERRKSLAARDELGFVGGLPAIDFEGQRQLPVSGDWIGFGGRGPGRERNRDAESHGQSGRANRGVHGGLLSRRAHGLSAVSAGGRVASS